METRKKKRPAAPPAPKPQEAKPKIQFGLPIETDKLKVTFDGTKVTYTLKETGEVLTKEYENPHALLIIYGRISRDPHGAYTQQCIVKARIAAMKHQPPPL